MKQPRTKNPVRYRMAHNPYGPKFGPGMRYVTIHYEDGTTKTLYPGQPGYKSNMAVAMRQRRY